MWCVLVGANLWSIPVCLSVNIGVARIFSWGEGGGALSSWAKIWWPFLVITLSYTSYTATNYLFISSAGCISPNSAPFFASFQQKCLEKIFSSPWGAPAPLHPPATPMSVNCYIWCVTGFASYHIALIFTAAYCQILCREPLMYIIYLFKLLIFCLFVIFCSRIIRAACQSVV